MNMLNPKVLTKKSLVAFALVSGLASAHDRIEASADRRGEATVASSSINAIGARLTKTSQDVVLRLFAGATPMPVALNERGAGFAIGAQSSHALTYSIMRTTYSKRKQHTPSVSKGADETVSTASMLGALVMFASIIGRRLN